MKKFIFSLSFILVSVMSFGQIVGTVGFSAGSDSYMGTLGIEKGFSLLESKKLHINPGIRINGFSGSNLDYITAPAKLTADEANIDTVSFASPGLVFGNVFVRLEYDITSKLAIGFDIDLLGLTGGGSDSTGTLRAGANSTATPNATTSSEASPTTLNVLLVGDNDLGSLNSTLYLSYDITDDFGVDAGLGFVFTEFTSDVAIGYDNNDRWRNKNGMIFIGLHKTLMKK